MAERICAADQPGCWPFTTAAEPARCGVAMEVPWKKAKQGGVPQNWCGIELTTLTPGATTSGLTRKSTSVGPWPLKSAIISLYLLWKYFICFWMVVEAPSSAIRADLKSLETM